MTQAEVEELMERNLAAYEKQVALHESGHVMLADALGARVVRVSVEGVRNKALVREGEVETDSKCKNGEAIVIALAGRAVDEALSQVKTSPLMLETDDERLQECIDPTNATVQTTPEERNHYWQEMPALISEWVVPWVRANQTSMRDFAERLQRDKVLLGDELTEAIAQAWTEINRTPPNSAKK